MIDSFVNMEVDYIIINVVGCGYILKEYYYILVDDVEYLFKV